MLDKNSIFYALYYGAISPWDSSKVATTKEYKKIATNACELQEQVHALLNDEGKQIFENFLKADSELNNCLEEEKFRDGFIFGARLMIETLSNNQFND